MKRWARLAGGFWFAPAPASRLALLRVLIGGYALVYLAQRRRMLARVAATDPDLFKPVGAARVHRRPLPVSVVRVLVGATLATNLAFVLGWRHRVGGPLFSGLLLWLLSYRNSWSMIYHTDNVLVLHVLILGATPAADALSLDARSGRCPGRQAPAVDWRYGWPIRLVNTVTVLTYFVSGVAKVKGPLGRRWASGEALRSQVAVDGLRKELLGDGAAPLAYTLYNRVALFRLLAVGSLAVELGAPVVLAHPRLARAWAINAFLMHWGIYAVMNIKFRYQMSGVIYAPFFEAERALDWIGRRREEKRWADRPPASP